MHKTFLLLFFVFANILVFSQSTYRIGILPYININAGLAEKWSLNTEVESRQVFLDDDIIDEFDYYYERTDLTAILEREIADNKSINAGYMIRFIDGDVVHRSIQQFETSKKADSFKIGQRISTDQTFSDEAPEFRFRYRWEFEKSLNSDNPDAKEFSFGVQNEYLLKLKDGEVQPEIRLIPAFGWAVTDENEIKAGIDYRLEDFFGAPPQHNFWLFVGWKLSI